MIKYKSGYKYQLVEEYIIDTEIYPEKTVLRGYILFYGKNTTVPGRLIIGRGYCWDGPSGPAIDTKNFMRGSLVHDVLYQLMRQGLIPQTWREQADKELRKICLEDGMSKIRVWWVYHAVKLFAQRCADTDNKKKILTAP